MDPLRPLERLEKDYYLGDRGGWYSDGENRDRDSDSSDDEVQKKFAAIAGVKLCSSKKRAVNRKDEFESDMDGELDAAFSKHTNHLVSVSTTAAQPSSSSAEETSKKSSEKHVHFKDDDAADDGEEKADPFYDPDEDADNEAWVAEHRRTQRQAPQQFSGEDDDPLPSSDAVLSCPACMTLLTRDCQRHELYKTQYRAMFVQNCRAVEGEALYMPSGPSKRAQKRRRNQNGEAPIKANTRLHASSVPNDCKAEDLFRPVVCSVCNTEIGVVDSEEVYHLFNVLSGYA